MPLVGKIEINNWNAMQDAPRNATWMRVLTHSRGEVLEFRGHFACDHSGEMQPPFEGFFYQPAGMTGFVEIPGRLLGWLPEDPHG